jgi:L-iditol 2-dehydrogenase
MRAARLHGKNDLRIEEVGNPQIGEREILLRVKGGFVCGTDIRMYKNGRKGKQAPITLGHEISGVIEEVGSAVRRYRPGMRAAVAPNMGCGVCDTCVSGNTHMCPDSEALGVTLDGGFAEYVRIPETAVRQGNVTPIPEAVSFSAAALAEPLSCVYNGLEHCRTRHGDSVLIIGAGPIGLMHAKLNKMAGAGRILMNDILPERLELCAKLEPAVTPVKSDELEEKIRELTGGRGVDVCITACPSPAAQTKSLELAAVNGRVLFFGGLPSDREIVPLNTNLIHYKQLHVTGTTRQSLIQYRKTLKLIAEGLVSIENLITAEFKLDSIEKAFQTVIDGVGLKTAITVG